MRGSTAASGSVRRVLIGSAMLLFVPSALAYAQYGGAPGGEKSPATPGAYPTPSRSDQGASGLQQGALWRDEDFGVITPETGHLDTVLVRLTRNSKRTLIYHRIRQDAPSRFRIATPLGPTVLRIRVAFLADSERPPLTNGDLLLTVDDEANRPLHVKAKRFRSATVDDSLRWISDARVLEVPVPEGHHIVEVRAAEPDREVVGIFEMPIARAD